MALVAVIDRMSLHMPHQTDVLTVPFRTKLTSVRTFVSMRSEVSSEIGFCRKTFFANPTPERPFPGVNTQMRLEGAFQTERFSTNPARERLFASMYRFVILQTAYTFKGFTADVASMHGAITTIIVGILI